jgi:hypothetical protein
MRVRANYIDGKQGTEIYVTGNDIYYNGTIYRLPENSFDAIVYQNGSDNYVILFWEGELVICLFVDSLEDLEKTDWAFEEIPEEYYAGCPVIEVESNEGIAVEDNGEEIS